MMKRTRSPEQTKKTKNKDQQNNKLRIRLLALILLLLLILLFLLLQPKQKIAPMPPPKSAPKLTDIAPIPEPITLNSQVAKEKPPTPRVAPTPTEINKQIVLIDFKKTFLQMVSNLDKPQNSYVSGAKVPYHAAEKFIVEAVDYGKVSTSEAISLKLWMSAMAAAITQNWNPFFQDWSNIEKYFIPHPKEQPNAQEYKPYIPANYVSSHENFKKYPRRIEFETTVGEDPLGEELETKYGPYTYLLHWYLDVDNWYGFDKNKYVKVDLFARGPHESTFNTIPHPSFDKNGSSLKGFVDLYVQSDEPQWRYSSAPDAELRIGQAMYWAERFAKQQHQDITAYSRKAAKLGEYARYALFDKYFRKIGEGNLAGREFESCHYLISWCVAWGGAISQDWAWRIGESQIHSGYQNPLGALYFQQKNIPLWDKSIDRQLKLINWVQSREGAIGGGVKNDYNKPNGPFFGMWYEQHPVYLNPPSNTWSGWQYFLMDRVAEYYYITGDVRAEKIISNWIAWITKNISLTNEKIEIPVELSWEGSPEQNNLTCRIHSRGQDVGGQALIAMTLLFWDKANQKWHGKTTGTELLAKKILSVMWNNDYDGKGIATVETRQDYAQCFTADLGLPPGTEKKMPWGKVIKYGSTFIDARPKCPGLQPNPGPYSDKNPAPKYKYHRSWAQYQYAIALGYVYLLDKNSQKPLE